MPLAFALTVTCCRQVSYSQQEIYHQPGDRNERNTFANLCLES